MTFAILYSVQPLLPEFTQHFHVAPAVASLSLSVTTATLAVCLLVAAVLSEAWGRKRLMTLALFASALLALVTACSPNFIVLVALRALLGVVLAGLPAIAMAYIAEEFHPNSLGATMGLYVSGTAFGGMFGRIAVGTLSDFFSWQMALIAIGLLSLACAVWFWISLPESRHFKAGQLSLKQSRLAFAAHLREPGLLVLFVLAFLLMGSFVTLFNYIGYLLLDPPYRLSQTAIGWIFVVYLLGSFSAAWMGKLADRHGRGKVLVSGIAAMLAGGLLTLHPSLVWKVSGVAVFTFGFFGAHSVASGWVGLRAKEHKAQASALYLLFYYLGSSIVGTVGGLFWSRYAWGGVIALIGGLLLVACGAVWVLVRHVGHVADEGT